MTTKSLQTISFASAIDFYKGIIFDLVNDKKHTIPAIVVVPRTDPIYNCHGYLSKIPVGAIIPFIEHYSEPGELIADIFAGSGMTGLAATISGRSAEINDISVLGQHIAEGYLTEVSPKRFLDTAKKLVSSVRVELGDYYQTIRIEDNKPLEMIRTVWSFVGICPKCGYELIFYDHAVKLKEERKEVCQVCNKIFSRREWNSNVDMPIRVVVTGTDKKQTEQTVQKIDLDKIAKASKDKRLKNVPSLAIEPEREMYNRSGLANRGISETKHFFSARNALVLTKLWHEITNVTGESLRKKLQFAFTAILPRASKRYQWSKKRPLNAYNHTYYIPPVYYEWNVFDLYLRKVKAVIRSDEVIFGSNDLFERKELGDATYRLVSADSLEHLKPISVDYIFTDPPFGSNIFYSDMSLFHEAWLGKVTDDEKEAVIYTCGKNKKNAEERYNKLLKLAFKEAYRVLKPGRYMSVVFGNSRVGIWRLILSALREAGFDSVPVEVAILDKGQRFIKSLNSGSDSVVTVDLIMTVHKPSKSSSTKTGENMEQAEPENLIQYAIEEAGNGCAKNPRYLYVNVLREAIKRNLLVDKLHLSDVLIALRKAGYSVDSKTGLLI